MTGSHGLVGSAVSLALSRSGLTVVGVDNDYRAELFGSAGSTAATGRAVQSTLGPAYQHHDFDIRDEGSWRELFRRYGTDVATVVHTAAQPSHDWSSADPVTDFEINALATIQLLESVRTWCPAATFVFLSTNKVYGDAVNSLDLIDLGERFDLDPEDEHFCGIDETFPIDRTLHSPFGVSKLSADLAVQEYGLYYDLSTVCLRAGTITGVEHSAVALHGFLAFLGASLMRDERYTVIGYGGKQVRDVIHAQDVAGAVSLLVHDPPNPGAVYNIGGGRRRSCSVLEAVELFARALGKQVQLDYVDTPRIGDHRWWISDMGAFETDYPSWAPEYDLADMVKELLGLT